MRNAREFRYKRDEWLLSWVRTSTRILRFYRNALGFSNGRGQGKLSALSYQLSVPSGRFSGAITPERRFRSRVRKTGSGELTASFRTGKDTRLSQKTAGCH